MSCGRRWLWGATSCCFWVVIGFHNPRAALHIHPHLLSSNELWGASTSPVKHLQRLELFHQERWEGEVQHYPWLSEPFLCPFGRKHDHDTFQLTSIELNNLRRSGASLQYHIKTFALKFPKAWYLKQNSALFRPQAAATSASLSICIQSIKETWIHQHVREFLVSWDSSFWQLCLGWHMFLPFPSVQECVSSFPWKPPWWAVSFYSCTYPELLHKSHWWWELELSSDFITWLKKSGCKLNLDA